MAYYGTATGGRTDKDQRTLNARTRAKLKTGFEKYEFDVQQMLIPGTNRLRGMYQLPDSPKYAGGSGSFNAPPGAKTGFTPQGTQGILGGLGGGGGASILGGRSGAPGGRGRGIGWAFGGKPMGLPPGEEAGGGLKGLLTVGGLAYIVMKVLL